MALFLQSWSIVAWRDVIEGISCSCFSPATCGVVFADSPWIAEAVVEVAIVDCTPGVGSMFVMTCGGKGKIFC